MKDREWFGPVAEPVLARDLPSLRAYYVTLNGARQTPLTKLVTLDALIEAGGWFGRIMSFGDTMCDDTAIMELDSRQGESFVVEGVVA
jgi:hypothetical protein